MHRNGRRALAAAGAVLVIQALLLVWMVSQVRVNPDEGIYLSASYRIVLGQLPYRDFMYPQMPYFAFLFVPLIQAGVPLLSSARYLSAACSVVLSALLYRETGRMGLSSTARVVLLAFFAYHGLKLSTHATAITHASSDLLAFASFMFFVRGRPVAAGATLGLATGLRLPLLPLLGIYGVTLWWRQQPRSVVRLAAGFALALAPVLPFVAIDPENFIFGTYTLHAIRGDFSSVMASLQQKLQIFLKWVLFPQDALLILIAASGGTAIPGIPAALVVALGLVFLQARPTYFIYVVQLLPFAFLVAAPGFGRLVQRRWLLPAVAIVYALSALPSLGFSPVRVFSQTGDTKTRLWNLQTVTEIIRIIENHSAPDDLVLSWWEGYPTLAGRRGYAGVGFWEANVARKLGDPSAARYHCMTSERIGALISTGEPTLIVAPSNVWQDLMPRIAERYQHVGAVNDVRVYARKPLR
jgi:drug/metabolite transporter superfamily protein YnfA